MKVTHSARRTVVHSLAALTGMLLLLPSSQSHAAAQSPAALPAFSTTDWMGDLAGKIGDTPLNALVIPGTHDSGTYAITPTSPTSPGDPPSPSCTTIRGTMDAEVPSSVVASVQLDSLFSSLCDPILGSITAAWAKAQDMDLTGQLNAGVRSLDLRVCPPETAGGPLMICHSLYSISVPTAITQIQGFAIAHPKEIVLAEFSALSDNGGTTAQGKQLGQDLIQGFTNHATGDLLLKPQNGIAFTDTLNTLWKASGNVIALDGDALPTDDSSYTYSQYLWPATDDTFLGTWPEVNNAAQEASEALSSLQCRCSYGTVGNPKPAKYDPNGMFTIGVNPTPDLPLIGSSVLDMLDNDEAGLLGLNVPGEGIVMNVIRDKTGWPANPPDSLQELDTRAARIVPWLLNAAGQSSTPRANLNIVSADFIEQTGLIPAALALDAGGAVYGPDEKIMTARTYIVPAGVRDVRITAIGGSGSGGPNYLDPNSASGHHGGIGGRGAVISAVAPVHAGQILYLFVGQNGRTNGFAGEAPSSYPNGGCGQNPQNTCSFSSGGGISMVSTTNGLPVFLPPAGLLLVAGGGAGGAAAGQEGAGGKGGDAGIPLSYGSNGGNGSGLSLCVGTCAGGGGSGGTLSQGGSVGAHQPHDSDDCKDTRTDGAYLAGGYDYGNGGGGGGAGYYGGGAGGASAAAGGLPCSLAGGGGGGGSSYAAPFLLNVTGGLDPNLSKTAHPGWTAEQSGNPYIIIAPV